MKVSNVLLRGACVSALLAVTSVAFAAPPQGYYRWKDDAGAEHFTQQPPPGRKSDFVAVSTGKATEVPAGESIESSGADKATAKAGTGTAAAGKPTGPIQGVPDKDPEKCKQAQDSQGVLNSHARIREKVGDDYRYLTPEEINEQKKLAQESTDVYCEPTPAK
jgi:hypothetical protein